MTRTYTQDEVYEECQKAFADGKAHASPSPETIQRLAKLETMVERLVASDALDRKYHEQMLTFMAEFKRLPSVIDGLVKAVDSLNAWRDKQKAERSLLYVLWTIFGGVVTTALIYSASVLLTIDERINSAINNHDLTIVE